MNLKAVFPLIFLSISLTEIIGDLSGNKIIVYVTKPLILISIITYARLTGTERDVKGLPYFYTGLFFALLGDVFLMIREKDLFIPGLASFLVMQIFYAYSFNLDHRQKLASTFATVRLVPFMVFALIFFMVLQPHLPGIAMKIAVGIYATSISVMTWMSLLRKDHVPSQSFVLVFVGAMFFMISDTIIAIDKFMAPVPFTTIWVMSTYCLAQYLITIGFLKTKQTGLHPSVSNKH